MNKKFTALLSASALTLSLFAPAAGTGNVSAESKYSNFNTERYTDRIDIDGMLERKANDEAFQKQAKQKIKENAESTSFNLDESTTSTKGQKKGKGNEEASSDGEQTDSNFTYDGGTKQFLTRNLSFKPFTLRSVGENVEIWVANDLSFPDGDPRPAHVVTQEQVDKLTAEFDNNIYPTDTEFFGTPDSHDGSNSLLEELGYVPEGYYDGEGDKIVMLVDNIKDDNFNDPTYPFFVAGFYWSTLEMYMDRNIITIDTNNWEERLESTFYGTTIHELQHLIHDDNDSDETSWLNEGMSTFSEYLGGYGMDAGSINFLLDHPENSLINWDEHRTASTGPETIADYGLVQLFTLYSYEQFGQEFIRALAKSEDNSIESFNNVLKKFGYNTSFTEVYQNFSTALTIDDNVFKGGKYGFENIDLRELPIGDGETRGMTVNFEKAETYEKDGVPAWGTDYKIFDFEDNAKIDDFNFNGVDFIPTPWETVADPLGSDNQVYWGNQGDEADNSIIFEADLTNVNEATLQFDNYIDIEEHWDFGVVQVSTDNGQTWTSLGNENTTSDIVEQGYPKIKNNLPGFTGHYEDWQQETFDLSDYAGEKVHISFRYLTDWGYNDAGWFVDNIEVPEIGLSYDGSSLESFQSMDELLENYVEYGVSFVNEKSNGEHRVLHVDPFNVTEEEALQFKQLFKEGKTYMTTYYAAPQESLNPVSFEYEIKFKKNETKEGSN
ncbi:Immune inhibitor A peptidase M6 [Thalassobacillus cyri]|uniref:Immune inhibitor A peptidase M6 n=1 Tax=Thalassobacillus cyri TaxID=571932 RepID=A0A1H4DHG5_9BACI|nr:immune inhibitor A domain-containing protein [Thalassobacillus cyri]SEA71946.1 Immune inhibitor A peptidase M6 [Thalassobacillus cyri]